MNNGHPEFHMTVAGVDRMHAFIYKIVEKSFHAVFALFFIIFSLELP